MNSMLKETIIWMFCGFFLFGIIYSGYSDVLCVGSEGDSEIETLCFPCCTTLKDFSELNTSDSQHNRRNDCSNCLDVGVDNLLHAQRIHRDDFSTPVSLALTSAANASFCSATIGKSSSRFYNLQQLYNKIPLFPGLATTILRC